MNAFTTCRTCRGPLRRGALLCSRCLNPQPHRMAQPASWPHLVLAWSLATAGAWSLIWLAARFALRLWNAAGSHL
jgi:predicted amidophosphoribosyltransferase